LTRHTDCCERWLSW